jgi:anti-anti-sigma factor
MTATEPGDVPDEHTEVPLLATIRIDGRCVVVAGELDLAAEPHLRDAIAKVGTGVIIDLANVAFIDSSGIRTIIHGIATFGDVRVLNASPAVRRVFELAGVADLVHAGSFDLDA